LPGRYGLFIHQCHTFPLFRRFTQVNPSMLSH
jgi:hypothetical protein